MTNGDLVLIIDSTNKLLASVPLDDPRYQPLLAQFNALLQEQLRRAKEPK